MAEPASSPSQSDSDDEARAVNDLEVIMDEVEDGRSTILTNPLMKTKRKRGRNCYSTGMEALQKTLESTKSSK